MPSEQALKLLDELCHIYNRYNKPIEKLSRLEIGLFKELEDCDLAFKSNAGYFPSTNGLEYFENKQSYDSRTKR